MTRDDTEFAAQVRHYVWRAQCAVTRGLCDGTYSLQERGHISAWLDSLPEWHSIRSEIIGRGMLDSYLDQIEIAETTALINASTYLKKEG